MFCHNKNKNELLALTGAVYSFVAYLTAFTLEVLFIIELAKRNSGLIGAPTTASPFSTSASQTSANNFMNDDQTLSPSPISAFDQAKLALESMQTHLTISCLAISILYFVLFVTSLVLIVALILRSTFFILIWMCIMTIMYLPELALIIYVSVYGWGLDTRNGQTELIFYIFRAALNVIFIFRTRKLYKEWKYEKNFFMLKSGSRFSGYDSPYFIGDSLTTTINPVFSSSTLHLDRYDQVRGDFNNTMASNIASPYPEFNYHSHNHQAERKIGEFSMRDDPGSKYRSNFGINELNGVARFQLGGEYSSIQETTGGGHLPARQSSMHSVNDNDDYADYELDLDYRTLTNQRIYQQDNSEQVLRHSVVDKTMDLGNESGGKKNLSRSLAGLSYSTQSLDRRQLRDLEFTLPEHVILRPLGHQPFDYLQRPGSSSNLSSINNLNTQPSTYSSSTKLTKKSGINYRYT